jgi:hypothetical protein
LKVIAVFGPLGLTTGAKRGLPERPLCSRVSRGVPGLVQGRRGSRENRKSLPDALFVGCQAGFNKRLMGRIYAGIAHFL